MSSRTSTQQGAKLLEHYCRAAPQFITPVLPDGTPQNPHAKYALEKVIGSGASGVVVRAHSCAPGADVAIKYAVKVVDLEGKKSADQNRALSEIKCLMSTNFFSALRCYDEFTVYPPGVDPIQESSMPSCAIMVLDFADAGDLREEVRIRHKQRRPFAEHEAGLLFVQLLMALHHIHGLQMIHRDIKTANVLLLSNGIIKLGDFGFSKMFQGSVSDNVGGTFCGTPYYCGPELWRGHRYSKKADMFSMGVLLYELLMLERPFNGDSIETVMQAVLAGHYAPLPDHISAEMRSLCYALLSPDPASRPSTNEVLQLPVVKLFINAFSQIVQRPDFDPILQQRIVSDMDAIRRSVVVPEPQVHELRQIVAANDSQFAVSESHFSPNTTFNSSIEERATSPQPSQVPPGGAEEPVHVMFGGMLLKKSSDGKWKRRYLCVCPEPGAPDRLLLKIGFSKDSLGTQSLTTPVAQFEDCFPVPPKFAEGHEHAFALATVTTAKKMTFVAPSAEACDAWLQILRSVLSQH